MQGSYGEKDKETFFRILSFLEQKDGEKVPTIQIAKHVFGKSARCKDVNPYLYRIKEQGLVTVEKNSSGGNPMWSLK